MSKTGFTFEKTFLIIALASFVAGGQAFGAIRSKKSKQKEETVQASDSEALKNDAALGDASQSSIKLPASSKKRTYFYKIDENIVSKVENGSPESLKEAVNLLRKAEADYAEPEKVLISAAAFIMEKVWPSETVTWEVFTVTEDNPYTGAINSVKNGIFDSSTGNVDLLTTLLPSLVMFSSNTIQNVMPLCGEALNQAREMNPDSVLVNYLSGVYFEKIEDYHNAVLYLKKAYGLQNKVPEICLEYSKTLSKTGDYQLAAEVISSIDEKNQNDLNVLKQNAYVSFQQGDLTAAEDYVARVLQQTPNDLDFLLFRARIFIEKNDYIHAVALLDMYSRQNDTSLEYLILRARVQFDWSKNTTAAAETIEKALQLYPESEEALMFAAKISSATDSPVAGKYADELSAFVLAKNPKNVEASLYALNGLIKRENWEEAYPISLNLVQSNRLTADIVLDHVTVCIKLGKKAEALDIATRAHNSDGANEVILQAYVYAYCEAKSREDAVILINDLLTNSSSKTKSYLYYRRSFLQKTEENTLADLRSSLIANPRNSEALFRLYEVYYAKNDYRKAQYYLRQVVAINPNDSSYKKLNEALTQLIK